MTQTTTAPATWSVWFRPHGRARWRRVADGLTSEAAAWQAALRFELSGDKTISIGDPNLEKRPR